MVVVVGSPSRRQTFCGFEILKDLQSQEFVSEATVEALCESVLPWTARFNVKCFDFQVGQPLTQPNGDELRTVVAAYELRQSTFNCQCGKSINYFFAFESVSDIQAQILTSKFVDDRQPLELLSRCGSIKDEIPAPHVIDVFSRPPLDRVATVTKAAILSLFHGYFQTFLSPESIYSFGIDLPSKLAKLAAYHPIAVTRKLSDQLQNVFYQGRFVVTDFRLITL